MAKGFNNMQLEALLPEEQQALIDGYLDEDLYEVEGGWQWYCYQVSIVDFGWGFLKSIKEVRQELINPSFPEDWEEGGLLWFEQAWESAQKALKECGYDGRPRGEEVSKVFAIPSNEGWECENCQFDMKIGFVVKQDNNGDTFVASPYAIPHLKECVV